MPQINSLTFIGRPAAASPVCTTTQVSPPKATAFSRVFNLKALNALLTMTKRKPSARRFQQSRIALTIARSMR
jgi:hypothetical protein